MKFSMHEPRWPAAVVPMGLDSVATHRIFEEVDSMTSRFGLAVVPPLVRLVAGACAAVAVGAHATPFQLFYAGAFNTQEGLNPASTAAPTTFTVATPFTIRAFFDDSTPNLAPPFGGPFNGFRAYAPSSATIDIDGIRYSIETASSNPLAGVAVAVFDQNSFTPGRYGVGLIADPLHDGPGIVGDFLSASPDFTVAALTPTTFIDFYGVGHGSGVCLSGSPPACPHAVTPWVLHDASAAAWNLTLGNFDEDYPVAHTPGASIGPLNTAQLLAAPTLLAVPEPSSDGLMLAGLVGLAVASRIRRLR